MAANRLTALKVERAKKPGMYADGNGLYLRVVAGLSEGQVTKNWVYRYMLNRKPHWMGLGPYPLFSLADARAKALEARKLRHEGTDPIEKRKAERAAKRLEDAKGITFRECAEAYIKVHRAGWKHPKHLQQWEASLKTYVYPMIGELPVGAIDTALVMKIIEPLWSTKTETMSRVRGRIELVLDWAKVRGYRTGENPALWRGHLDKLLPRKSKVRKRGHYTALPYDQVPTFMAELRKQKGTAARALEFLILTAVRVSDLAGSAREDRTPMLWDHVAGSIWTIPATKNESEHKVPLSPRALEILEAMKGQDDRVVFPEINDNAIRWLLNNRMKMPATMHGFRAAFKTWASERTSFRSEISEAALAHVEANKVKAAYERTRFEDLRRKLMRAWEAYCMAPPAATVISLPQRLQR